MKMVSWTVSGILVVLLVVPVAAVVEPADDAGCSWSDLKCCYSGMSGSAACCARCNKGDDGWGPAGADRRWRMLRGRY